MNKIWLSEYRIVFSAAFSILTKSEKRKVILISISQVMLTSIDLFSIFLLGIAGALSISGIQSTSTNGQISKYLNYLGLSNNSFQFQVAILSVLAASFLISRTLLSVYLTRKSLQFLAHRSAKLSASLVRMLISKGINGLHVKSSQETLFSVTYGATSLIMGVLATAVNLVSDLFLLLFLGCALFLIDFTVATASLIIIVAIGLILNSLLNSKAQKLGLEDSRLNVQSSNLILEIIFTFREALVRNRTEYYSAKVRDIRGKLASVQAEIGFLPSTSKYVVEIGLILSAIILSGIQFATKDAMHAFSTLAIFLAAGTRLAPALLRVQQGILQINNNVGVSRSTVEILTNSLDLDYDFISDTPYNANLNFLPEIKCTNLFFKYSDAIDFALSDINLEITAGSMTAIVGPSGAGKTTFIDVLLGVNLPTSGQVQISSLSPKECMSHFPGKIAFVPQETYVSNSSVAENVALGFDVTDFDLGRIKECLKIAQLEDFVSALPGEIFAQVGENGSKLSGGQRQRLGIARALYTKPELLIFDEATSSLDAETELALSRALQELKGSVTIISIAHRLSTIREADQVFYFDNGKVLSNGTFNDVRASVKKFDEQARMMGL